MRGALLLLILGALYLGPTVGRFSSLLDEGLVTSPAERLVQGELLYRDVYLFTPPGPVGYMAAAFKLGGVSVATAHWALLVLKLALLLALYAVSVQLLGNTYWALAPPLSLLALYLGEPMNYANHWIPNLPFLLAVWLALRLLAAPSPSRAAWLGAAVTATGLTLQTFGVAVAVPAALAALETRQRRCVAAFAGGLALAALPFLAWLAATGIVGQFVTDTIVSNLHRSSFERVSLAGFGRTLWLLNGPGAAWPDFLTGLLLVLTQALGLLGPLPWARGSAPLRVALVAGWMMLLACSYRLMPGQLLLHGFMPLVTTTWLLRRNRPGRVLGLAMALGFAALAVQHYRDSLQARYEVQFPRGTVRVASAQEAEALTALARFMKRQAPDNRAFLVPYVPNLYFLAGLTNPTRYVQMRPLQHSREQMAEALTAVRDCPVFRFPAYESDGFLRWGWPDLRLSDYRAQESWFYEQLSRTHQAEDCGAIVIYRPNER